MVSDQTSSLFEATEIPLADLLGSIGKGLLQLPNFQRDFVWRTPRQRSLLQSIQRGFPAGSLLLMEVSGTCPFNTRPIKCLEQFAMGDAGHLREPKMLALDGQQRLTTLAYMFISGNKNENEFYLNLKELYSHDSGPESVLLADDNIVIAKRRTPARSYKNALMGEHLLPTEVIFRPDDRANMLYDYKQIQQKSDKAYFAFLDKRLPNYFQAMLNYRFPVVLIRSRASLEVVSTIFQELNTRGQKLTAFDLCVARYSKDSQGSFDLRADLGKHKTDDPKLNNVDKDGSNFLQAVALEAGVGNKKATLADTVEYKHVKAHGESVYEGMSKLATELEDCMRVSKITELPYDAIIAPMTKAMKRFPRVVAERAPFQRRMKQWIASSALKKRYSEGGDAKQQADARDVLPWLQGDTDTPPEFVADPWLIDREVLASTEKSSRGKLFMLCLRMNGAKDFLGDSAVADDHHLFPEQYLNGMGRPKSEIDRFLNHTWLSAATNRSIGGKAPSKYIADALVPNLAKTHNLTPSSAEKRLAQTMLAHFIDHDALEAMKTDDYDKFIDARLRAFTKFLKTEFAINVSQPGSRPIDQDAPVDSEVDEEES